MTPEFPYVQLPGSYRGFFRKASLWEGIDHILSVKGTRFNEEYRRFYYGDIQAFIVEKRARAGSLGWWIILLVLLCISALAAAANDPHYSWVAFVVLLSVFLLRLDIAVRRSCRCSVQTAVSREPLPSLIRRKAATAAIARLQIRIASEQGNLPPEMPQLEEGVGASIMPPDPAMPPATQMLAEAAVRERRQFAERGVNLAIAALFIFLINSVFTFYVSSGGKRMSPQLTSGVGYAFIGVGLIPICLALQQIGGLRALRGLRILLVSMFAFSGLRVVFGPMMGFITAALFRSGQGGHAVASFQRYYVNTNGGLQIAFAAGGLLLIFAKWATFRRGDTSNS